MPGFARPGLLLQSRDIRLRRIRSGAIVMPGCAIGFMWGFVDDFLIDLGVVPDVPRTRRVIAGIGAVLRGGRVHGCRRGKSSRFQRNWVYCYVHQAALSFVELPGAFPRRDREVSVFYHS